jgi:hypothetical protein
VKLGEAEAISAVDNDGVRRRDVEATLDDGRTDEYVEATMVEIEHHVL